MLKHELMITNKKVIHAAKRCFASFLLPFACSLNASAAQKPKQIKLRNAKIQLLINIFYQFLKIPILF